MNLRWDDALLFLIAAVLAVLTGGAVVWAADLFYTVVQ